MRRTSLMLATMMTAMLAIAAEASAARTVRSPFGGERVTVDVGHTVKYGPIVCYQVFGDPTRRQAYSLGTTAGLNDNYVIYGSGGGDFISVYGGGSVGPVEVCGNKDYTIRSLVYNGRSLDVRAGGGSDYVDCGALTSTCYAEGGDDALHAYSPTHRVNGGSGDDYVVGTSGVTTDRLEGGPGGDCLNDPMNRHSVYDCGTDFDWYIEPASGRTACEKPIPDPSGCFKR